LSTKYFISIFFFSESIFCTINPHPFNAILKMISDFSLQLNIAKCRHVFSPLAPETEEEIKLTKNKIRKA